jgi:hypothetical protein
MKKSEVLRARSSILAGKPSSLPIETTTKCPLGCPGYYAFNPAHLQLRQLSYFRGAHLVTHVLALVDRYKPSHVSRVGSDPLVRYNGMHLERTDAQKRRVQS